MRSEELDVCSGEELGKICSRFNTVKENNERENKLALDHFEELNYSKISKVMVIVWQGFKKSAKLIRKC